MCVQATERSTDELVCQLALESTISPSTSHPPHGTLPHHLSFNAATLSNLHAGSPSHELEDLQGEIVHGETHVTSTITSPSRTRCLLSRTQGHFHSNSSQRHPSSSQVSCDSQALCIHPPRNDTPMPCLRGKSRQGAASYAARGKKMPHSAHLSDIEMPCTDIPPYFDGLLVLPPVKVPAPVETQLESTQELSPLSNKYGYRVEWFDAFGNSLGYAPPPTSPPPPRRPPPAFTLTHHLSEATSATSTDSPTRPPCNNHANQEEITKALHGMVGFTIDT